MAEDDIEARILTAAARLIAHYGYDKTTIDEIAREAGVAKSTLYARWKSKDALVYAVLWHESILFMDDWLARVEADPEGGSFGGIYGNALLAVRENAFLLALYQGNRRIIGKLLERTEMRDAYQQRRQMIDYMLKRLQALGAVRADIDIDLASYLGVALQFGLLNMGEFIPDAETPMPRPLIEETTTMFRRYLEPSEGGDSEAGKAVVREIVAHARAYFEEVQQRGFS